MMHHQISTFAKDFLRLFYPKNCAACGTALQSNESEICLMCHTDLPLTKFWEQQANPMEQLFWGRAKIENALALFFYKKGTKTQQLIHNIKYRKNLSAGKYCGSWLGAYLKEYHKTNPIDYVIPVPLHLKRFKKRGYNQCDCIGEGLAESIGCRIDKLSIRRVKYNISQTKKGRFERWKNVDRIFEVKNSEHLKHKHILLIDDVVTTGSTMEACISAINEIEGVKVSVAVLGFSLT